jgi:hypothetical protein
VRLALYVFGLRDRPVRNTRITSDDADKLATAISTFPYDANARSRGDADFKEIACPALQMLLTEQQNMRRHSYGPPARVRVGIRVERDRRLQKFTTIAAHSDGASVNINVGGTIHLHATALA